MRRWCGRRARRRGQTLTSVVSARGNGGGLAHAWQALTTVVGSQAGALRRRQVVGGGMGACTMAGVMRAV